MSLDWVDKRVKKLVRLCNKRNCRSILSIFGPESPKQIPVLYEILCQRKSKVNTLYCSKDESMTFYRDNRSHLKTWLKDFTDDNDSFHHCPYSDLGSISHRLFHLAVFQDFEELTPQALCAALQTVQGGGIIIFLFPSIQNVENLYTLNWKADFKTPRFSKRFASMLGSCPGSLFLDGSLSVVSSGTKLPESIEDGSSTKKEQLVELREKHGSDTSIASLISICCTIEQAELLLKCQDLLKKQTMHSVLSVSSPVGRGKSAILGLAIALGLALKYSNIFISSMSFKNVDSVFKFLLKGLDALNYKEDVDFDLIESDNLKFKNALMGINVFKDHPQTVRFIFPFDIGQKLDQAELVVFDEAAAIPLPVLKNLFGSYVVLMASSTSGPGASNPSLYSSMMSAIQPSSALLTEGERFQKVTLNEPIFHAADDYVETWVNKVFCLEPAVSSHLSCGFPIPENCRLLCVNRDALFNGTSEAEEFLQQLSSLLSSSSRIMSPEDILNLGDCPNYNIFCLLPPASSSNKSSTDIICALLVHLEHEIPDNIVHCGENLNDPVSSCFNEWKTIATTNTPKFISLSGAHIINIVTHQSFRKMGYASQALQFLKEFYEGKCISLDENCVEEKRSDYPFLQKLTEVQPDNVEYIIASCNLVSDLLRFWKKSGYTPTFISDKQNIDEAHRLFMVKSVTKEFDSFVETYWHSFLKYFCCLLGSSFRHFEASLALNLIHFSKFSGKHTKELVKEDVDSFIPPHKMKSLGKYCQNLQDFQSIMQFIPTLANLYFKSHLKEVELSRVQEAILLSFGLQYKTADDIAKDLGLPSMQIHGLLNRTLKKITKCLADVIEKSVAKTMETPDVVMKPIDQDLNEELEEAALKIKQQQEVDALKLKDLDVSQYAIKGSEDDWQRALLSGRKTLVSIKSIKAKPVSDESTVQNKQKFEKNKKKRKK